MEIFAGILGLAVFTGALWLWSEDRKAVRWKYPAILLGCTALSGFIFTRTSFGIAIAKGIGVFFSWLNEAALNGVSFVFGDLPNVGGKGAVFFFNVLMPIILISLLTGVLLKFGVFQFLVKWIGKGLSKISGQDDLISFQAPNSFILSQTGIFMSCKEFINNLTERQIWSMALIGNATFSTSLVGSYMNMLEPKYVVSAILMNMFIGLFAVNIIFPESKEKELELNTFDTKELQKRPEGNLLQVISDYSMSAFQMIIAIMVGLVGILSLIALLNMTTKGAIGITFQDLLGKVLSPIAYLMGAGSESAMIGNLIGTKFITNEFVSILGLQQMHLSAHATAIASVSVLSFANLSCIAIIGGGISALSKKQGKVFYKKGLKIITVSFICSLITGTLMGLMVF